MKIDAIKAYMDLKKSAKAKKLLHYKIKDVYS